MNVVKSVSIAGLTTITTIATLPKSISSMVHKVSKQVDDNLKDNVFNGFLGQAESRTGFRKLNIIVFFSIVLAIYLMVGRFSDFVCNFVGFAYPAYKSIKAIESTDHGKNSKWLIYWVVYSVFILIEYFAQYFLSWFVFYWFFKCLFLIFCMFPEPSNGSMFIYKKIIRPLFLRHKTSIEESAQRISVAGASLAEDALEIARRVIRERLTDAHSVTYSDLGERQRRK